jgi:hypothetical protein
MQYFWGICGAFIYQCLVSCIVDVIHAEYRYIRVFCAVTWNFVFVGLALITYYKTLEFVYGYVQLW